MLSTEVCGIGAESALAVHTRIVASSAVIKFGAMEPSQIAREESGKHSWDFFVQNPPSIAQGGKGVVVPGCPACKVRIYTEMAFHDHVRDAVLARFRGTNPAT